MAHIVNMPSATPAVLEKTLAGKLLELLDGVGWLEHGVVQRFPSMNDRGFDFCVELHPKGRGKVQLWVQCKAEPRPSQFPSAFVTSESNQSPVLVLAAPLVSSRMAEVCKEAGWGWFDLAGNCQLDVPGLLHIHRIGLSPVHRRPRPTANLSTPEAGRVIRALLLPEHTNRRWTQRYLAEHFGEMKRPIPRPSLGLVNKVVRHLRDEAFIEELPNGGFRVRDPLKLLFAWRDVYHFDRQERHNYFTLLQGNKLRDALANFGAHAGGFAVYAVFSAADILAPHVRQSKTWLYVPELEMSRFEETIEAKQVESGENLVVLIPDDDGVFYMGDRGRLNDRRLTCTNEVQTYVDLYHCGGRGKEAAEALLEQRLKPMWMNNRLKI